MTISSRTPEGEPGHCPVCGNNLQIEPSEFPRRDAPCPCCGTLLLFEPVQVAQPAPSPPRSRRRKRREARPAE